VNQQLKQQQDGGYMRQRRVLTALAIPLALALVAASCGSDDSSSDATTAPDGAEATTPTEDTTSTEDTTATEDTEATEDTTATEVTEPPQTETPVMGGSVSLGLEAEATGLRPWEDGLSEPAYNIMYAIYDPLMTSRESGGYGPYLAESLEPNDDFTVWTMTLRPDITFSNGTALTAQTIADSFPIQQTGAVSSTAIASAKLASVAATGDLTVEYTLIEPNSAFAGALALAPLGFPFDPAAALADPVGYSTNPIGTGPFTMKSRDIDNETIVERNPNYWRADDDGNQLPYLDSVTYRPIPDEGTRLDALLSGTVSAIESLRGATVRDARDAGDKINVLTNLGNSTGAGFYNTQSPPLDDQRVRLGLTKMNDQARVIEALGNTGISAPTTQFFSVDSEFWTEAAADTYPTFDFDGGTELIQEYIDDPARSDGKSAGDNIDVELSCPPDPTLIAAMQVIQQVWAGSDLVNVTLTSFDQATHINNGIDDKTSAHCWRFGGDGDPAASIDPFVASAAESVSNFPNYDDPEMQQWALEAGATDDFETRKELYSKIMVRINEEALTWYSGGTAQMIAVAPDVKGVATWTLPDGEAGVGIQGAQMRPTQIFVSAG
jgi:peptide/nickel transport system substrate-binding protein